MYKTYEQDLQYFTGQARYSLILPKKSLSVNKKERLSEDIAALHDRAKKKTDLCRRLSCREYAEKSVCHEAYAKCYFTASSFLPFPSADGGIELFTSSWKYAANSLSLNGVPASGVFGFPSTQ